MASISYWYGMTVINAGTHIIFGNNNETSQGYDDRGKDKGIDKQWSR